MALVRSPATVAVTSGSAVSSISAEGLPDSGITRAADRREHRSAATGRSMSRSSPWPSCVCSFTSSLLAVEDGEAEPEGRGR
jgi:hypothetical protein